MPLAMAALDVLDEEELASRAARAGEEWRSRLATLAERHPSVGDVRGRGLMVGIDLIRDAGSRQPAGELAGRVVVEALRRGWIVLTGGPAGNVISLSPPLNVPEGLLTRFVGVLDRILAETAGGG